MTHLKSPDDQTLEQLPRRLHTQLDCYALDDGLLTYSVDRFDAPRILVPNDADLRVLAPSLRLTRSAPPDVDRDPSGDEWVN